MKKFCFIIGLLVFSLSLKAQVTEEEFQALKVLYNSTGGDNWTDRTGWEHINTIATKDDVTTSWKGILSISDGHVTNLNFYNNNLTGSLPDEIGEFRFLTNLVFNSNQLSGPLPQTLKQLTSLKIFAMAGNKLNIQFPSELVESWPNLMTLNLNSCGITGTIPDIFSITPYLRDFEISNNGIEGELPPSLDSLYLHEFYCDNNKFEGSLPLLTNTTDIYRLSLANNNFTGTVPEHYGDFVLQYFLINDNNLSGLIPEKILENPVYFFTIQNNYFTFAGIEPIITKINESTIKNYSTNKKLPLVQDTISLNENETLTLDAATLSIHALGGSNNNYKWFLNDVEIYSGNSPVFSIPSVAVTNAGTYRFEVTNTIVTDLTLQSQEIEVAIKKVNHNPTDIFLSKLSIDENVEGFMGGFSTIDPDEGDDHTYSLVNGDGVNGKDNGLFMITGDQLFLKDSVDYESIKMLNILVVVFDGESGSITKAFTIVVNDVNETPWFDGQVSIASIDEIASNGLIVFDLTAKDAENDTITFAIKQGNEDGAFAITDNILVVADSSKLDYETKNLYSIIVTASDGELSSDITLTIELNDVKEKYSVTITVLPKDGGTTTVSSDSFVSGDSVTLVATPMEGFEFVNWTENGNIISNEASYSFVVYADYDLVANFEQTSGITDRDNSLVNIYPNPVLDYINLSGIKEGSEIRLTTSNGVIVYQTKAKDKNEKIEVGNYKKGIYFVTIRKDKKEIVRKLLIE